MKFIQSRKVNRWLPLMEPNDAFVVIRELFMPGYLSSINCVCGFVEIYESYFLFSFSMWSFINCFGWCNLKLSTL